jgi:tetratricopeptide (TPR) repeat protein
MSVERNQFKDFKNQIRNAANDEEIVRLYIDYRNYLVSFNPEQALMVIDEVYKRYENSKSLHIKYKLLAVKASTHVALEQFDVALPMFLTSYEFFLNENDKSFQLKIIGNMTGIFYRLELFNYAIYLWKMILNKFNDCQNTNDINVALNNIMMVSFSNFHHDIFGIEVIDDMIAYYEDKLDNNYSFINYMAVHSNKARYYTLKKNFKLAIASYEFVIKEYDKKGFEINKISMYWELGRVYNKIGNEEAMIQAFRTSIQLGEQNNLKNLFPNIYFDLYEYYKSKSNFKKALNCLEKFNKFKKNELELSKKVNFILKEMGLNQVKYKDNDIINIFQKERVSIDSLVFLDNIEGNIIKVDIHEIVLAQLNNNVIDVFLANGNTLKISGTFKALLNKLSPLIHESKSFFEANSRDTLVNLFWLSRIDKLNKTIYLRPFYKEFKVSISKRQWIELNKILYI